MILFSCQSKTTEQDEVDNNTIEISKAQFLSENMSVGTAIKMEMEEKISFSGKIVSISNAGLVKISAPVEGIVMDINVQAGQELNANNTILKIGGSALIDLQQELAISSAKMKQLKANFNRAKQLFDENINTENDYLIAESNYKSELANYSGLKLKLENIGLNISNIENGKYASTYNIKTPIAGQVSQINCSKGQFISAEHEIAEVVNKDKIELKLSLFEKDFAKISKGQIVVFRSINDTKQNSNATISRIGNTLNSKSNTFDCYATIDKNNTASYAINHLVSGEVIIASDSAFAVPQTAVLSAGNKKYVFVVLSDDEHGYRFEKADVKTGKVDKNFIELIDFSADKLILLNGTYNIGLE